MNFYDVINKRRTVRNFTNEPVNKEVIERIISAAIAAPTNNHMRSWEYVVITERSMIAKVLHKIPKTFTDEEVTQILKDWDLNDPVQQKMYRAGIPMQYEMLSKSGCLILPLYKKISNIFGAETLSELNEFASIWCSVENILLASTAEELGCALRIPLGEEHDYVISTLGIPKEYIMPCYLAVGHIAKDAFIAQQKPVDINQKLHWNEWKQKKG